MLDSFPEKYVKINSVSCNLFDKDSNKIYTCVKLSASNQVANLL